MAKGLQVCCALCVLGRFAFAFAWCCCARDRILVADREPARQPSDSKMFLPQPRQVYSIVIIKRSEGEITKDDTKEEYQRCLIITDNFNYN